MLPHRLTEVTGPLFGSSRVGRTDYDLTAHGSGDPIGQRIVISGRVVDGSNRPVRETLVEVWQANAAGRYTHTHDRHDAPLDPNFNGIGRCLTDGEGWYRFVTIRPGSYPWENHTNAWRPAHIHFSLFGRAFVSRLVTQMYFPGDPLLAEDPIFRSVPDAAARDRMICRLDHTLGDHPRSIGYRWDIVLRGREETPFEEPHGDGH